MILTIYMKINKLYEERITNLQKRYVPILVNIKTVSLKVIAIMMLVFEIGHMVSN